MRFVDIMLCFPTFFLILAVITVLEPSIWNIMIVIGLTGWMGVARLVRADILSLRERDYVLAARASAPDVSDHLPPYPSECDLTGAGHGDPGGGRGDPDGVGLLVSRYRRPAADTKLGKYPHFGEGQYRIRLVAVLLPGARHPDHRPGVTIPRARASAMHSIPASDGSIDRFAPPFIQ